MNLCYSLYQGWGLQGSGGAVVSTLGTQTNLGSSFLISIFLGSLFSASRELGQETSGSLGTSHTSVPRETCPMLLTGLLIVQVMVNLETILCLVLQTVVFWVG